MDNNTLVLCTYLSIHLRKIIRRELLIGVPVGTPKPGIGRSADTECVHAVPGGAFRSEYLTCVKAGVLGDTLFSMNPDLE
jgi:hypothetical protein